MTEANSTWSKIKDVLGDLFGRVREPWRGSLHPLELKRAILDEVEGDVVALGGGRRILPYNHLHVRVLASDPRDRMILEAAFGEGIDLADEIRRHLAQLDCPVTDLTVDGTLEETPSDEFGDRRFLLEKSRRQGRAPDAAEPAEPPVASIPREPARPRVELSVLPGGREGQGTDTGAGTDPKGRIFDAERIHIGRLREILDEHGRLRRRNDLAFSDDTEVERSVSREHARIQWVDDEPRLVDERSAGGTRIYRSGQSIRVSSRDRRGVRLQDGDLLYFGRAAVRFRLLDSRLPGSS